MAANSFMCEAGNLVYVYPVDETGPEETDEELAQKSVA